MNIFHFLGTPTQQIQVYTVTMTLSIFYVDLGQWPSLEPIDWRYLPYIFGLFFRASMISQGTKPPFFGHGDFPLQELTLEGHEAPVLCVACDGQRVPFLPQSWGLGKSGLDTVDGGCEILHQLMDGLSWFIQ